MSGGRVMMGYGSGQSGCAYDVVRGTLAQARRPRP